MAKLPKKFEDPYDPSKTEDQIYKTWLESGYFNPDNLPGKRKETFSIILPPPNVTGTLHMGHGTILAIEDIMTRYHRMRGKKTLWLPGTDHAAIATQAKVEKILVKEEKKNRHDLGREAFLKRVETFAKESHDSIFNQVRKLGASVDWSREAFTLDEKRHHAVSTAFKNMYDDGLIYRGNRIVNWDPKGQTTVSDDEVEHEPTKGKLYTFQYSKDFPISIATTRPETKIGDTAVAVHPDDERYKKYIGEEYDVNFLGADLHIKIISDESIDQEYGTGALGVTPAHSSADWELGEKNDLEVKQVINEYAKMVNVPQELEGMKTKDAREYIVKKLSEEGLLEQEEEIEMNLSKADRSGGVIEPLPKLQWFIDVNKKFTLKNSKIDGIQSGEETSLKEIMRTVVERNSIEIIPDRFRKIYFHWTDNLRDWCISRQIWYGHRIPVWYRTSEGSPSSSKSGKTETYCGVTAPEGNGWEQDLDTLDTWFSSGLWTFSTLGWPEETEDLKTYHPTNVLETGYDILFFWVARMILMTGYHLGDIPFKTIYLHGIVRDEKGQKMSKSIGNVIDPLDMVAQYGADATRLSLIIGCPPGADSKLSENKIRAYKKFSNKIWNASRFVLSNLRDDFDPNRKPTLSQKDKERIEELQNFVKDITDDIEGFRFHLAGEKLYNYFWHTFADVIIEEAKPRLESNNKEDQEASEWLLYTILETNLRLLHPFAPFITEEIWASLPKSDNINDLLIISPWPNS